MRVHIESKLQFFSKPSATELLQKSGNAGNLYFGEIPLQNSYYLPAAKYYHDEVFSSSWTLFVQACLVTDALTVSFWEFHLEMMSVIFDPA